MYFKELIDYHKPTLVVLMETKCGRDEADQIMAKFNYLHNIKVDSQGVARGIYIIWNDQVTVQPVVITQQEIYLFVKVNNFNFSLTAMYARPYNEFKHALRYNFRSLYQVYDGHWLTFGDFNVITAVNEKFGGSKPSSKRIHEFNCLLNDCNLLDLGFNGPKYTWSNCRKNDLILEKLDRFMANPSWIAHFPNSIVTHLPRTTFDHCPIMINLNLNQIQRTKFFKLESMWLNHPMFDSLVDLNWPNSSLNYLASINQTIAAIFTWNQNTFGNILKKKKDS